MKWTYWKNPIHETDDLFLTTKIFKAIHGLCQRLIWLRFMLWNGIKKCVAWAPFLSISMDIHCWWETFHCSRQKGRALSYDEFVIGVYKDEKCNLLVGHLPIEISSFSYHFLKVIGKQNNCENYGKKGKRNWFSSPTQLCLYRFVSTFFIWDKNCSIILEARLEKREILFQDQKLKFYKNGGHGQFPFFMK